MTIPVHHQANLCQPEQCDQCDYQTKIKGALARHVRVKHTLPTPADRRQAEFLCALFWTHLNRDYIESNLLALGNGLIPSWNQRVPWERPLY